MFPTELVAGPTRQMAAPEDLIGVENCRGGQDATYRIITARLGGGGGIRIHRPQLGVDANLF
jgi:hypothetical protein